MPFTPFYWMHAAIADFAAPSLMTTRFPASAFAGTPAVTRNVATTSQLLPAAASVSNAKNTTKSELLVSLTR